LRWLNTQATGNNQVAINIFELNMFDFRRDKIGESLKSNGKPVKNPPAGIKT